MYVYDMCSVYVYVAALDALTASLAAAGALPHSSAAAAGGGPSPPAGLDAQVHLQMAELRRKVAELGQLSGQTQQRLGETEKCLIDHENGLRQLD